MRIPSYDVLAEIGGHGPYLVCRGRRQIDGLPVLLQAASGPEPQRSHGDALERQFDLLQGSPIAGVTRPLAIVRGDRLYLVLEDRGLELLRERTPLEIPVWLSLAVRLAAILDAIHRRGLVHAAVTPGSVLLNEDATDVELVNLGLVSLPLKDEGAGAAGPMAYASPEQTGRVNRPLDHRTDLYALGVTLYEALTGVPPFTSEDPLEVIHAHIAKTPASPSSARADAPEQLSRIVLKLLAKSPEDRYQSASGLGRDLERCRTAWESARNIPAFSPGADDAPARFTVPARL